MVKFTRVYRNNSYILVPLKDFLKENHDKLPAGWTEISLWINKVFSIKNEQEYKSLSKELQVEHFDIVKIREEYEKLKKEGYGFDDDILMFISFLLGTTYFSKIGNPSLEAWLSAVDINHPFKTQEDLGYGYSFFDAIKHEFGQNAVRKKLLSTIRWISSQGG